MRLGLRIGKPIERKVNDVINAVLDIAEMQKAGGYKYVKREGTPGHYKYWYRLPDGSLGNKAELKAAMRGKKLGISKPGKGKMETAAGADGDTITENGSGKTGTSPKRPGLKAASKKQDGYGMHNIEVGDAINFETADGKSLSGEIKATGKDGVTVSSEGQEYRVLWKDIRGFTPKAGTTKPDYNERYFNKKKEFIEPDKFTAAEWTKQFDDPNVNDEKVFNSFENPAEIKKAIVETEERLKRLEETIKHRIEGEDDSAVYTPERQELHKRIFDKFLSPEKINAAKPEIGEHPTLIMLGGRGGSGKSWFEHQVYDPSKAIVLDADLIKKELPEFEGWNANQTHQESGDLLEKLLVAAREKKVNIVLDATMKTPASAMKKVLAFKDAGYLIECHYMHLPRQEAAKRAVSRFMGKTKRYVPISHILANKTNEETFDMVKKLADAWSFRDNNVPEGDPPILISEGGKSDNK
jgi:predicted ABC-type ATPase